MERKELPESENELLQIRINELIASRKPGFSLPQPFYTDAQIFSLDMDKVWFRYWLYAGHTSQLPEPDSYFLFQLGEESVVVNRDEHGDVRAHANVCTHRGSRILHQPCGKAKNLVCPYHQWVFRRDGSFRSAKFTSDDFDGSGYGLQSVHCRVLEGFIFLCFAPDPPDFDRLVEMYKPFLEMYQIEKTKVVVTKKYAVKSNWKLLVENARECYHCAMGHPEYCSVIIGANLLHDWEGFQSFWDDKLKEWEAKGIPVVWNRDFPRGDFAFRVRYPYQPGFLTESLDGKLVAPMLGHREDTDAGVFSIAQYPSFWLDVNCDHVLNFRFLPVSATETDVTMTWLVREDAVEGKDYDIERLTAVWTITGEQDWRICADNQMGVNSRYYRPGPYTTVEEPLDQFASWYLDELRKP